MQRILVVDDDPHIREIVAFALSKAGFVVALAANGVQGLALFESEPPDLVVLDVLMPELDGLEVCRRLRAKGRVPLIFLTSVDDELDRVIGLELGADDYVTKPFSPRELVARVRTVLRRATHEPCDTDRPRCLVRGRLRLDLDAYRACFGERMVELSATERNILAALLGAPTKVFTRSELMERAYLDGAVVSDRTIDSHVKRIRKKLVELGCDGIETVHGVGYRLGRVE